MQQIFNFEGGGMGGRSGPGLLSMSQEKKNYMEQY